jgi:hypothetical protein
MLPPDRERRIFCKVMMPLREGKNMTEKTDRKKTVRPKIKDEQTSKSLNVQLLICIDLAAKEENKRDRLSSAKDALKIAKILNGRLLKAERRLTGIKKQLAEV